jgi:DNA-binding GntR family transcriptional regulator
MPLAGLEIMNQTVRYKSTADYATAEIQRLILNGDLLPGAKVDQIELAVQLDVSRHPVRQAIERLAERGFILLNPHHSAVVAEISTEDLVELYSARTHLERWAVRESWPKFTPEFRKQVVAMQLTLDQIDPKADLDGYMRANRAFHLAMYQPCGNRHMLRTIAMMFDLSERYQRTALTHTARMKRSRADHAEMVDAITRKDRTRLIDLIDEHNKGTQATVQAHIKSLPKS